MQPRSCAKHGGERVLLIQYLMFLLSTASFSFDCSVHRYCSAEHCYRLTLGDACPRRFSVVLDVELELLQCVADFLP